MNKIKKVHLLILNRIHKKLVLREFLEWKWKCLSKSESVQAMQRKVNQVKFSHKVLKFDLSHTHDEKKTVKSNLNTSSKSSSNIFEELKSSFNHKLIVNSRNPVKQFAQTKSTKILSKKTPFGNTGAYPDKSCNKNTLKPSHLDGLAIVSSSSALSMRTDKVLSMFSTNKNN